MNFAHPWLLLLLLLPAAWALYEWRRTARPLALGMKAGTFALILLALAQPSISVPTTKLALGVMVDTSASIPPQDLQRASQIVSSLDSGRGSNAMRVVPFARSTRITQASENERPWKLTSAPGESGRASDLEAALRETVASLPPGMLPRLVLISDGKENKGSIARAAWQARQSGIPIDTYALPGRPRASLRLESISLPVNAFTGESFPIDLAISASASTPVEVELAAEGRSLGKSRVTLAPGVNPIRMQASLETAGTLDLSIAVRAVDSGKSAGEIHLDQAVTLRRPKILYVTADPVGIDGNLPEALSAAQFDVLRADDIGTQPLDEYQLLILNNQDLERIPDPRKNEIERFVQHGGGLAVIGGERNVFDDKKKVDHALDRILPAKLLPPQSAEGTAVILIIDKSSSMEGPKMDLAKSAATGVVSNLRPIDQVGVLIFDNSFRWAVQMRKADDPVGINRLIAGITPDGGTQIAPALTEAFQKIRPVEATYRHILLLTDGISEEGNAYAIAREAKGEKITVSTIGLGNDVHREYLDQIATLAEGKFYPVKDPAALEQIVLRDVMEHTGTTAVEKSLKPTVVKQAEILEGVDMANAPALKGYVRFEVKPTAETVLQFDRREPLLMRWQYGLGRTAVFTSDAKSRWASDWVKWPGYNRLWTNIARDLLPHTQLADAGAEFDPANSELMVNYRLPAGTADGNIPNIFVFGPGDFKREISVMKTGTGVFQGRMNIGGRQGLFRVRPLVESRIFPEVGVYIPEAELNDFGSNPSLLKQVSEYTGGKFEPPASAVFNAGSRSMASTLQLWPGLLAFAAALNLTELIIRKWKGVFGLS